MDRKTQRQADGQTDIGSEKRERETERNGQRQEQTQTDR